VTVSDRTRKLLWGKAGNRCSICNHLLSEPGDVETSEAPIGEEAHIISSKPRGPRYAPLPGEKRDSYDNLILVCPNHHRVIDDKDQAAGWSVERLQVVKTQHEAKVAKRTEDKPSGPTVHLPTKLALPPLYRGKDLLSVILGAHAYSFDYEDSTELDERQLEAIKLLFDSAFDYGELGEDLSPSNRIDAASQLTQLLEDTQEAGLIVYGGLVKGTAEVNTDQFPWRTAFLWVRRLVDVVLEYDAQQKEGSEA
jgi:hypothetical protein